MSRPPLLTTPDVVGLLIASLGFGWAVIAVVFVQPTFAKLFDDFGGVPAFTAVWMKPWVPLVGALIPLAVLAEGIVRRVDERGRVARTTIAIVLSVLFPGAMLVALYLPLFTLSAAIK